eukprot:4504463-Pyramimonas_sp.AAC.1
MSGRASPTRSAQGPKVRRWALSAPGSMSFFLASSSTFDLGLGVGQARSSGGSPRCSMTS